MKLVPFFLFAALLFAGCASGPSAHRIVGAELGSPNATFSEINNSLKNNGYMGLTVSKKIGPYSLAELANWELVFEGEKVVFADKLSNGKDAEAWMNNQLAKKDI